MDAFPIAMWLSDEGRVIFHRAVVYRQENIFGRSYALDERGHTCHGIYRQIWKQHAFGWEISTFEPAQSCLQSSLADTA